MVHPGMTLPATNIVSRVGRVIKAEIALGSRDREDLRRRCGVDPEVAKTAFARRGASLRH